MYNDSRLTTRMHEYFSMSTTRSSSILGMPLKLRAKGVILIPNLMILRDSVRSTKVQLK